ncbi:beta-propeller domain-containing protein [Virgibacillus doumboii]|uniref:beta-propeller domain-containing protein n=1 Tax=Virgibacillus doumboii TaxID=2697503 RepID=UPI0013E02B66|nr:beta-propeller domain-containing protein [Virgibacillus doumboii]
MNKIYWWIAGISFIVIITVTAFFFSNTTTANIPSKSSYAPAFKDWSIHFSEPMNPETFTKDTVTVMDNNNEKLDVSFDWNDKNTVLTLRAPDEGYNIDHRYMITVSNKVETTAGNQLDKTFTHSFTAVAELPNIKDKKQLMTLLKERMEQRKKLMTTQKNDSATSEESSVGDGAAMDTASSSVEASATNVQVAGIDEGDMIKTDGDYVYFSRGSDVVITSVEKTNSQVASTISPENFRTEELYLQNNLLVMIGHTSKPIRKKQTAKSADSERLPMHRPQTSVFIYDVEDRKNPEKVREITFEGSLNASRLMDGHLYLIANQHPPFRIMEEGLENTDIRPFVKDTAVSNKAKPINFDSMYFFPESDDENFLLLGSIDLNNLDEKVKIESYLGASNQMYMSKNHIYIAVNKYNYQSGNDSDSTAEIAIARPPANTEINQFKINDGKITYHASAIVKGTLINQFAMDERNGIFHVATTKGSMWNDEQPSTNNLYTYDLQMNPVGALEGLAEGERIYSVRFMEEVAYMVTFKQVDPLFVIDLKNPEKPTVRGKLKIPGFSNYLHPLDEDHVIGFGQNTKLVETEHSKEPRVRIDGLKISVFDVSDPTKPKEEYSEIIGRGHSYTQLNHDHNVLYNHPEKNLFGFPATLFETKTVQKGDATYEEPSFVFEGAFLYNITPENGIEIKDTITHQPDKQLEHPEWKAEVKRMVSAGNTLYTFSLDQMKVYDLQEESVMQTVDFPELKERHF